MTTLKKRIWIDLDNSPHVPLFHPIIDELTRRDYSVTLTARDCFQVRELSELFELPCEMIGRHYGKNRALKLAGVFLRALQMAPLIKEQKPDLAISHGSRAQLLLAAVLGIPSVLMLDYEHVRWLPFIHPALVLVPEVLADRLSVDFATNICAYPGIKEDIYVTHFKPDPGILEELGITSGRIVVTLRPPATEAHYHTPQSERIFEAAVDHLGSIPETCLILLPRTPKQVDGIKKLWPKWVKNHKIVIPKRAVDGRNLIWFSDLVISGGGTMNREAAALRVPVYTVFRGKLGAVDQYLSRTGRLVLLKSPDDVRENIRTVRRTRPPLPHCNNRSVLDCIGTQVASLLQTDTSLSLA